jgi:hypothetical protein
MVRSLRKKLAKLIKEVSVSDRFAIETLGITGKESNSMKKVAVLVALQDINVQKIDLYMNHF